MKKIKLKIGDVAKQLGIKKSIIRQWEQEFGLKQNDPSQENNRYYTSEDMTIFSTIKDLLRTKGLSISDAKAQLTTVPAVKYIERKEEKKIEEPLSEESASATLAPEETIDASPVDSTPQITEQALDASPIQEAMPAVEAAPCETQAQEEQKVEATCDAELSSETHLYAEPLLQPQEVQEALAEELTQKVEEATHKVAKASMQPAEIVHDLELHLAQLKERLLDFKKLLS